MSKDFDIVWIFSTSNWVRTITLLNCATLRETSVSSIHVTFLPHCVEVIENRAKLNLKTTVYLSISYIV
jgi:hypothetical protein